MVWSQKDHFKKFLNVINKKLFMRTDMTIKVTNIYQETCIITFTNKFPLSGFIWLLNPHPAAFQIPSWKKSLFFER